MSNSARRQLDIAAQGCSRPRRSPRSNTKHAASASLVASPAAIGHPTCAEWIARRIAAVTADQLEAVVAAAEHTRVEDAQVVLDMLFERRRRVLAAWGLDEPPAPNTD